MNPSTFLLLNLALAFYNAGTIWAHEVDIFRSWKLVDPVSFHRIQAIHWRNVPYWVFLPGRACSGRFNQPHLVSPGPFAGVDSVGRSWLSNSIACPHRVSVEQVAGEAEQ